MSGQQNQRNAPYHRNGTATGTAAVVDLTYLSDGKTMADWVNIQNTDGANALLVSFDGGTTFRTIRIASVSNESSLTIEWRLKNVVVKSAAASTTYEIICTSGKQFRPF